MEIFQTLSSFRYGELHFGTDARTGLRAIVAVHSTKLGPGIGGCRIRAYATETEAIEDAVRLARGMTYKAALAGLPHGGGKAVIWSPPEFASYSPAMRAALLESFGRFVDGLQGRYVTTEDSGTSPSDMDVIARATKHVLGASGGSGDPSPLTALGVRRGIEAIAHGVLGRKDLVGLKVAIQGVGHVGEYLARELKQLGAQLLIADVDDKRVRALAGELGAEVLPPATILEAECDVLSPCALGGALTPQVVSRLRTKVIAGAANNQLATPDIGKTLFDRGIFYAPDYAINAGGLINVAAEYAKDSAESSRQKTLKIYDTIATLISRSKSERVQPEILADRIVEEKIF